MEARVKGARNTRWIYGRHVVGETLSSRKCRILGVLLVDSDKAKGAELLKLARRAGVKVSYVSKKELDKLAEGGAHQGVAAKISDKPGSSLEEFLSGLSPREKADMLLVALDQIQDPHNFGAIARSAACLGAGGLLFPERRSAPITQVVLSSSAGAIQKIPTFEIGNLAETLVHLKEQGFWVYGAAAEGRSVWEVQLNRPMVLVVGGEGKGIRPLVRTRCDELVAIPQSADGVSSLNASCAASVLLYEAARQRVAP